MTLRIDVLTLFPEVYGAIFAHSILGRAVKSGILDLRAANLRSFATDRHHTVDDTPYGGGPGMVLRVDVLARAIRGLREDDGWVVLMTPSGRVFRQADARRLASKPHLVLVAGHYEGYDERVGSLVDEEFSIGDYVLTGGESAAWVVLDATARLVPGVIQAESLVHESFATGLLEAPQYTRPPEFEGQAVPPVLLSGDHGAIRRWRQREALKKTLERRPDLLAEGSLTAEERLWLAELETADGKGGIP